MAREPSPSDIAAGHVEQIYILADKLMSAYSTINVFPVYGVRPALDEVLNKPFRAEDLDTLSRALRSEADQWQGEIDAEAAR